MGVLSDADEDDDEENEMTTQGGEGGRGGRDLLQHQLCQDLASGIYSVSHLRESLDPPLVGRCCGARVAPPAGDDAAPHRPAVLEEGEGCGTPVADVLAECESPCLSRGRRGKWGRRGEEHYRLGRIFVCNGEETSTVAMRRRCDKDLISAGAFVTLRQAGHAFLLLISNINTQDLKNGSLIVCLTVLLCFIATKQPQRLCEGAEAVMKSDKSVGVARMSVPSH
ncbi:hypothetical protein E2C01_043514 [Portunus trituberculatus]|uniref:Uncharacterized protein n=1 Tax=Portunus trituberculatus TaxID=210409 RepID=A0A5B7FT61_PORTR|nr:hypothetical protein [Portunus trituberculatus]